MTRLVRCALAAVVLAAVALDGRIALAQVSIPNIQNPINKAKAAAGKTSDQINATNKIGNEKKPSDAPGQAAAAQAADQQRKAAAPVPASQKGAAAPTQGAPGKAGAKPAVPDSSVQLGGSRRGQVTIMREAFSYDDGGRRDPFVSLMLSGDLRPILADLVITGIIFDPDPRRSVAILVDASTGEVYRVHTGQTLARMKVTRIGEQDVSFSIDEFGLSRSETLIIDKSRKGAVAAPRRP